MQTAAPRMRARHRIAIRKHTEFAYHTFPSVRKRNVALRTAHNLFQRCRIHQSAVWVARTKIMSGHLLETVFDVVCHHVAVYRNVVGHARDATEQCLLPDSSPAFASKTAVVDVHSEKTCFRRWSPVHDQFLPLMPEIPSQRGGSRQCTVDCRTAVCAQVKQ